MQGNDLGNDFPRRIAVVMEPLLCIPPRETEKRTLGERVRGALGRPAEKDLDLVAARYTISDAMVSYIRWIGREYNMRTEMWSFTEPGLLERLIPRVSRLVGDYCLEYRWWASLHEAYQYLRATPEVHTVFDGSLDRVERYWHLRGQWVEPGMAP